MTSTYTVIGPKTTQEIGPIYAPNDFFGSTRDWLPNEKRFLWGWIAYKDIFPGTKIHLTEFCQGLVQEASVDNVPDSPLMQGFQLCQHHNCADENCDDYKDVVDMVIAKK
jgi:hypothetical protein